MAKRAPALRVYTWQTFVRHGGELSGGGQVRAVAAAASQVACARLAGVKRPGQLFNLCETGHDHSIQAAMSHPGEILVRPISSADTVKFRILRPGLRWAEMAEAHE